MNKKSTLLFSFVFFLGCVLLPFIPLGCTSNQAQTALTADATAVAAVNTAMALWSDYVNSGKATPQQITTVSNAYQLFFQSQLIASNTAAIYAANPSTNIAAISLNATAAALSSESNIVNVINQLTK